MGCGIGGRGETDAVFEVRKKEVQFESVSTDETTGVFGIGEIADAISVAPIAAADSLLTRH
jgi:hypothetical protein